MIVPMKKITLLCLEQDKTAVLEKLRDLGVMQLRYAKTPESADVTALTGELNSTERAAMLLITEEGKYNGPDSALKGKEAVARVLALTEERNQLAKTGNELERELEALQPWGDFDPAAMDAVRENGLYPYLCAVRKQDSAAFRESLPENAVLEQVSADRINDYLLLILTDKPEQEPAFVVSLPRKTLSQVRQELDTVTDRKNAVTKEMLSLKNALGSIQDLAGDIGGKLEFACAKDGMAEEGALAWIFGYVPVTGLESLQNAAKENGMALLVEDPAEDDDQVPTYIVKPKFLNIMDPLFDFIGVSPGYRENDVNMFFLIFFPVFFGLIIGDAGYGFLFIAITALCICTMWKKKPAVRLPLSLFLLLSAMTVLWGWLNGSWFGITRSALPAFMQGTDFLGNPVGSEAAHNFAAWVGLINENMDPANIQTAMGDFKNKFIQFLCFAIAGVHLPAARIFRFFADIRSSWRAFGQLGWALFLVANMIMAINLIVYTNILTVHPMLKTAMIGCYGIGLLLVVVTIRVQDSLNLPFSLVGSFVDVLSYIRLFAVGLAGAFISEKFNGMGVQLMDSMPETLKVIGAILMILVAVFGNLLNIALGFLSVLVHAVRLNTLEFSNHIEMQWAGFKFRPFKKNKDTTK